MREKDDSEALSALYSEIEAKEVLLASLTGKNNRNRRKALRGAIEQLKERTPEAAAARAAKEAAAAKAAEEAAAAKAAKEVVAKAAAEAAIKAVEEAAAYGNSDDSDDGNDGAQPIGKRQRVDSWSDADKRAFECVEQMGASGRDRLDDLLAEGRCLCSLEAINEAWRRLEDASSMMDHLQPDYVESLLSMGRIPQRISHEYVLDFFADAIVHSDGNSYIDDDYYLSYLPKVLRLTTEKKDPLVAMQVQHPALKLGVAYRQHGPFLRWLRA